MAQGVADTEMIRRQNRQLVLDALRRDGPSSRSQVAASTGLSNASLTAIASDLVAESIIVEMSDTTAQTKARGRPAVRITHNRDAGHVLLFELDVNRCRISLVDYAGVLTDRIESGVTPTLFADSPPSRYFLERIGLMIARNPETAPSIQSVSISVQGILDTEESGLKWSPIDHLAGHDITGPIASSLGLSARLYKRGRLMADGMRWLNPRLDVPFATVFVGSTIGMGLNLPAGMRGAGDFGTEFGHMIHVPNGAACRCGARGCIEAYAADYAVLRSAFSVPEHTAPASAVPPADYQQIIARARQADRNALHAFALAGQAIGYGIGRLISIVEIARIVMIGPATAAYDLMQPGIAEAVSASLMGKMRGLPPVELVADAGEPIYRGLMMKTLTELDSAFAARTVASAIRRRAQ